MLSVDLREAITELCARAHAERMTVEQVIVQLKDGWGSMPEFRRLPRGGDHEAELACVITQCILDFYAEDRHPPGIGKFADSSRSDRGRSA